MFIETIHCQVNQLSTTSSDGYGAQYSIASSASRERRINKNEINMPRLPVMDHILFSY